GSGRSEASSAVSTPRREVPRRTYASTSTSVRSTGVMLASKWRWPANGPTRGIVACGSGAPGAGTAEDASPTTSTDNSCLFSWDGAGPRIRLPAHEPWTLYGAELAVGRVQGCLVGFDCDDLRRRLPPGPGRRAGRAGTAGPRQAPGRAAARAASAAHPARHPRGRRAGQRPPP